MNVIKRIFYVIISLVIALIPEIVMYLTYEMIQPTTDTARVLLLGLFWFGGGSLCLLFAFFGFMFFVFTHPTSKR